jgi:TPR repeat protein
MKTLTLCGVFVALCVTLANPAKAQDSDRLDWLRNPAMGNYKAYAEFKMAHYAAAREVWETLAEVGNGDALFNLGILAEDGLGEPKNMTKAEALYTSAARSDNFKAQYRLGLLYSVGRLLPRDVEKARLYLTMAAQHGDQDALTMLANLEGTSASISALHQADLLDAAGQHAQAAAQYQTLADRGDALAQTRLAWLYEAGRGVTLNLTQAAMWFEVAAQQGQADAQYALSVMYRTGRGREKDTMQSLCWLTRSAAQNHASAKAALTSLRDSPAPACP